MKKKLKLLKRQLSAKNRNRTRSRTPGYTDSTASSRAHRKNPESNNKSMAGR